MDIDITIVSHSLWEECTKVYLYYVSQPKSVREIHVAIESVGSMTVKNTWVMKTFGQWDTRLGCWASILSIEISWFDLDLVHTRVSWNYSGKLSSLLVLQFLLLFINAQMQLILFSLKLILLNYVKSCVDQDSRLKRTSVTELYFNPSITMLEKSHVARGKASTVNNVWKSSFCTVHLYHLL